MSGINNDAELIARLLQMKETADNTLKVAIQRAGIQVRDAAVNMCPVDTGELRQSIHEMTEITGGVIASTVYTNKEYAPYVEFGTGPKGAENHAGISPEVSPVYSSAGWTYMNKDGEFVHTNGKEARPFMYPALKDNEERLKNNIRASIRMEVKKICNDKRKG